MKIINCSDIIKYNCIKRDIYTHKIKSYNRIPRKVIENMLYVHGKA